MNMASAFILVLLASLPFVSAEATEYVFKLTCQDVTGVIKQDTTLPCSVESQYNDVTIKAVSLKKKGEKDSIFLYQNKKIEVNSRDISWADQKWPETVDATLVISNIEISDEGKYEYTILTDRGYTKAEFTVKVIAQYKTPIITSRPKTDVEDGKVVDLYCNASGGYPKGSIKWFDQYNTDWTKSAELQATVTEDKLVNLSSKLHIPNFDSSLAPYKCIVFNSKNVQEGEEQFEIHETGKLELSEKTKNVAAAAVVVIGSVAVGILLALLLFKRRRSQQARRPSTRPMLSDHHRWASDVEEVLNLSPEEIKKELSLNQPV
ncbi:uncharacterized protein zgc:174863 [Chanos chanos]|uniref:Uncharacterized protein zgc:174863 n=1 Tax=Chanos chanos TaxID=29144 RepID=A0A6J2W226_CHACN|nr:uncharacterized protein LOC115818824 [Chanos chanos]